MTTLRKMGSMLQGHPDMKKVPGVDMSTGSLGQVYLQHAVWLIMQKRQEKITGFTA